MCDGWVRCDDSGSACVSLRVTINHACVLEKMKMFLLEHTRLVIGRLGFRPATACRTRRRHRSGDAATWEQLAAIAGLGKMALIDRIRELYDKIRNIVGVVNSNQKSQGSKQFRLIKTLC